MRFDAAERWFQNDRIRELAESEDGLRYLKPRSLSRKAHLQQLFDCAKVAPKSNRVREILREAYNNRDDVTIDHIHRAIQTIYSSERTERANNEDWLIGQLYRMRDFDWGGLHQNSLERTIVDRYVKNVQNYRSLCAGIDNELHESMRGYVLCSWYNHWTSIIIEDIFMDHQSVMPAVGRIKKIDFFIKDVPFDLKVTYFPEAYIRDKRKETERLPELAVLRRWAKNHGVEYDTNLSDSRLLQDLWTKTNDHPGQDSNALLSSLIEFRRNLIKTTAENPKDLIRWLYENQGTRRFDASNRLFLILVDSPDFFSSWKLKRMRPRLVNGINEYLDNVSENPGRDLRFAWQGENHNVKSDAIIVVNG